MGINNNSRFYDANDVADMCECSKATAYRLIKRWNFELTQMGYDVPKQGYCVKKYVDFRLGFDAEFERKCFKNERKGA